MLNRRQFAFGSVFGCIAAALGLAAKPKLSSVEPVTDPFVTKVREMLRQRHPDPDAPCTPQEFWRRAENYARYVLALPKEGRDTVMQCLKEDNPCMNVLVKHKIAEIREIALMKGVPHVHDQDRCG